MDAFLQTLETAIRADDVEAANHLLQREGALNDHSRDYACLYDAAKNGQAAMMETCAPYVEGFYRNNALHYAAAHDQEIVIDALLSHGADIHYLNDRAPGRQAR